MESEPEDISTKLRLDNDNSSISNKPASDDAIIEDKTTSDAHKDTEKINTTDEAQGSLENHVGANAKVDEILQSNDKEVFSEGNNPSPSGSLTEKSTTRVEENSTTGSNDRVDLEQVNNDTPQTRTSPSPSLDTNKDNYGTLEASPSLETPVSRVNNQVSPKAATSTEVSNQEDAELYDKDGNDNAKSAQELSNNGEHKSTSVPDDSNSIKLPDDVQNNSTAGTSNINTDNITSVKRKLSEMLAVYEPIDPTSFKPETNKKRIAGKFIEKFWEPLDSQNMNSLDKLLNMCINRTIEKYKGNTKVSKKMVEAQHILTRNWTNEMNRKSFRSRLNVTNVPLPSSMQSTPKAKDSELEILNYDHLTRRMQFLETYLLAELKQLSDLESYYSDLELVHNLDLNYLHEFKKTTEVNKSKMIAETITKRENLGLNAIKPCDEEIDLVDHSEIINSSFDPNHDKDTQDVLHLISSHLKSLSSDTTNLTILNEKLETLYNLLNKC